MLFNSAHFLIFFPIVVLISFLIPGKIRKYWLLISSFYFYMCWNPVYILLLLFSIIITWSSGILLERSKKKKIIVFLCIFLNLTVLFIFKYLGFAEDIINTLFRFTGSSLSIPRQDLLLPVGISFYTFQALGYTIDVYRGDIAAERNILKYSLFVSFFPQLVAGPIERSKNLMDQLITDTPPHFNWERARDGFMLMIWGFFLKLVLADRIAIYVDRVFSDLTGLNGWYIIVAVMLFAIQIYCDFNGYSTIAKGAAKILGIHLMDNFDTPYFSESISEFWRRWHISLTSWFRDYLYIPLGGNRKGKIRKHLNTMIVFLLSGLWHGASITYVIWGGLNGVFIVIEDILRPINKTISKILHLDPKNAGNRIVKTIITFLFVDFAWLFFRAENLHQAIYAIKQVYRFPNPWILFDQSLYSIPYDSLDRLNWDVMIIGIIVLFFADYCHRKGIIIRHKILQQDWWCRWLILSFSMIVIIIFGIWGIDKDAKTAAFLYFQF